MPAAKKFWTNVKKIEKRGKQGGQEANAYWKIKENDRSPSLSLILNINSLNLIKMRLKNGSNNMV